MRLVLVLLLGVVDVAMVGVVDVPVVEYLTTKSMTTQLKVCLRSGQADSPQSTPAFQFTIGKTIFK